jgi:hypothetical protein
MRNPQKCSRHALRSAIEKDITETIPPGILEVFGTGLISMPRVVNSIHSPLQQGDTELAMVQAFTYDITLESTRDKVDAFADLLKSAKLVDSTFTSELSVDLSLALCVVLARMLLQAEKNARILRRDLIPQISGALVRDVQRTLGRTRVLVIQLASEFTQDRATFEQAEDASVYKIPDSLANSIVSASAQAQSAVALPRALAVALAHNAGIDDDEWDMLVDLDSLLEDPNIAIRQYSQMPSAAGGESSYSRLQVITENLRHEAGKVFARDLAATPETSTSIRLSALLLAAEINKTPKASTWQYSASPKPQSRSQSAILYRNLVAAITWLERRINGADPAAEMIMLAIE